MIFIGIRNDIHSHSPPLAYKWPSACVIKVNETNYFRFCSATSVFNIFIAFMLYDDDGERDESEVI